MGGGFFFFVCWMFIVLGACKRRTSSAKLGKSHRKLQTSDESGSKFPSSFASTVLLNMGQGMLALQFVLVLDGSGVTVVVWRPGAVMQSGKDVLIPSGVKGKC